MDALLVLVGYATAQGSTAGVGERIATVLTDAGHEVVCRPVGPDLDPAAFDAIVVGSAVHNMSWLPAAIDFLGRAAVSDRPIWCFSVGGVNPRGAVTARITDLEAKRVAKGFPQGFVAQDHRVFGGVVQMSGVPIRGRLFWRLVGSRPGNHRDWPAIDAWAESIAAGLTAVSTPAGGRTEDIGSGAEAGESRSRRFPRARVRVAFVTGAPRRANVTTRGAHRQQEGRRYKRGRGGDAQLARSERLGAEVSDSPGR
jgi:menaquinone-dependent protoporphyrinogen oxidase